MEITSVDVRKDPKGESRKRGSATIVLDNMVAIHDIRIIDGDNGLFIAMPSHKTKSGKFRDYVHPINQEVRTMFEKEILDAYEKAEEYVPNEE